MTTAYRSIALLALVLLAPPALAEDFNELCVVRTDPTGGDLRRRLTLKISGADGRVSALQENAVVKDGKPGWDGRVFGSGGLTRRRLAELGAVVRDALAAEPAGALSPASTRDADAIRHRVTIDRVSFEVVAGKIEDPYVDARVRPLLAALDALFEKHLPPQPFYRQLRYTHLGEPTRVLEISPTGNLSLETGGDVVFKSVGEAHLKKLDALARAAGPFVPENKGRTVAVAPGTAAGSGKFELELELFHGGPTIRLTGTVGSYAASAAATGALVDDLEATLRRATPPAPAATPTTSGLSGGVDRR